MGGNFNAKTGEEGAIKDGDEGKRRVSKDEMVNKQGEEFMKWLGEEGWGIMNGTKEGDEKGELTFTGGRGGQSLTMLGDRAVWDSVNRLEAGEEVESDHQSVSVWIGKKKGEKKEERR